MREDQFGEHVQMGRNNAAAINLVRRHCRHARVEFSHGNSWAGSMLGLPLGRLEMRCEHAPEPRVSGHHALDLAVDFYRDNCVGCGHRQGTGELPNLATVVAERDAADEEARRLAERAARDRAERHAERRRRRRQLVAGEGYVVRDLAEWLDRLDADAPRSQAMLPEEREAASQLVETARHAPQLFSRLLVQTLVELAADTAEPIAFVVIEHLVRFGRCDARAAIAAALAVLPANRVREAADLLDTFSDQLRPEDLPAVLSQLVELAAQRSELLRRRMPAPRGFLAAAKCDLNQVTMFLINRLTSADEWERADVADASALLLGEDPSLVVALGPALVASIDGEDVGYADYPHPAWAACRALGAAWRGDPDRTMAIIEAKAAHLDVHVRGQLMGVVRSLDYGRDRAEALTAAVGFVCGGWEVAGVLMPRETPLSSLSGWPVMCQRWSTNTSTACSRHCLLSVRSSDQAR